MSSSLPPPSQFDGIPGCNLCGAPAENRACSDCGAAMIVVDCIHSRPGIWPSAYGESSTCCECEAVRDRTFVELEAA